jgi:DNA repair exonuclease SbcCD ATPase subunit
MADETVDIDVNINGADEAAGKFTRLQTQIRETRIAIQQAQEAGDQLKFNNLKGQLDELEDKLEVTQLKSKQFDDALAGLPGPAGKAGSAIKGLDGVFKLIAANPVVAVIAGLAALFMALKKSLESTAEGQQTLNRVSSAFSGILGPILATLEKVAVPLFNGIAFLLEKVAVGFQKFAKFLGISESKIKEATLSVDKVQQEANKKEEERQKDIQTKRDEAEKERQQKAKAAAATRKQQQDEANKIINEAELSLLSAKDREVREREQRYNEELKKLKLAGVKDLTKFEAEYRADLAAINKKYDDEEKKKAEDKAKKIEDDRKKELATALADEKLALDLKKSQGLVTEEEYQSELFEIKKKYAVDATALTQAEIENNNALADNRKKLLDNEKKALSEQIAAAQATFEFNKNNNTLTYADQLKAFDDITALQRKKLVLEKASADQLLAFDQETADKRKQIEANIAAAKMAIISNALATVAQAVGENTVAGKALAIAQATIDTYAGANKALATYPAPFGQIAAGTVILAGLLNVRKILATKLPAAPGTSGAGSAGGGNVSIPTPTFGGTTIAAPQIGATAAQTGTLANIVAGSINRNNSTTQPIRAYVIGNEVTSQQQMDRRIRTAARLGG